MLFLCIHYKYLKLFIIVVIWFSIGVLMNCTFIHFIWVKSFFFLPVKESWLSFHQITLFLGCFCPYLMKSWATLKKLLFDTITQATSTLGCLNILPTYFCNAFQYLQSWDIMLITKFSSIILALLSSSPPMPPLIFELKSINGESCFTNDCIKWCLNILAVPSARWQNRVEHFFLT